jgi:hypothetical protein
LRLDIVSVGFSAPARISMSRRGADEVLTKSWLDGGAGGR